MCTVPATQYHLGISGAQAPHRNPGRPDVDLCLIFRYQTSQVTSIVYTYGQQTIINAIETIP